MSDATYEVPLSMNIHGFFYNRWANIIGLSLTGVGIGWLIGLSVSPVVSIVVTSVIGSAAAIVAVLGGLQHDQKTTATVSNHPLTTGKISALPLTILVIGISIGAIFGILGRNQHWFGSPISSEIKMWSDQGIAKDEVFSRIFDRQYPDLSIIPVPANLTDTISVWTNAGIANEDVATGLFEFTYKQQIQRQENAPASTEQSQQGSILFGISGSECNSLSAALAKSDEDVISAFESSTQASLRNLPSIIDEPTTLREIIERVLCIAD